MTEETQTEKTENTYVPASHMPIQLVLLAVVCLIVVVGIVGFVGWQVWSNRRIDYVDSAAPLYEAKYAPLEKKLVSGEIVGTIQGPGVYEGRIVSFCSEKNGRVAKEGGKRFLECGKDDVKQATVGKDNVFTIRLRPNTYLFNVPLEGNETSDRLPGRIEVKTGQTATLTVELN